MDTDSSLTDSHEPAARDRTVGQMRRVWIGGTARARRRLLGALVALLVVVAPGWAQSMPGSLMSDTEEPTTADGARMVRTAAESLRSRAETLIASRAGDGSGSGVDRDELMQLLDARLGAFEQSATEALAPLRMDGILEQTEASQAIGRVAEATWLSFDEAVEALLVGSGIPPRPSEYERSGRYAWEMFTYVVTQRNELLDFVVLLAAIAAGVLIAWMCSRVLTRLRTTLDDRGFTVLGSMVSGVRGPLYVTLALAGVALGLQRFWLPRATEQVLWLGIHLAFVAASLWLTWSIVSLAAQGLGWMLKTTYREPDRQAVAVIRKCLHLLVIVVYAVVVAEVVFGVELQNVLIGVGLLGLAVTLAAQDSLKNLFGSLTIVIDRPFRVGDLVEFKGFFGTIEDIGFRSTKLRELDGHLVTIPNAEIVREPVQNVAARPWIRRHFKIGLRYDTPPEKVREAMDILREVLGGRSDEPEPMPTHVVFEGFGDSTLTLLVQYCVEPGDYWQALSRGSDLHMTILERFGDAGIDFAYPTRTSVIETDETRMPLMSVGAEQ